MHVMLVRLGIPPHIRGHINMDSKSIIIQFLLCGNTGVEERSSAIQFKGYVQGFTSRGLNKDGVIRYMPVLRSDMYKRGFINLNLIMSQLLTAEQVMFHIINIK
jgi:hypothetical protein